MTSPLLNANGRTRPALLASITSVSPRAGTLSTNYDEVSLAPNCHTTVTPLYVCTNQPSP